MLASSNRDWAALLTVVALSLRSASAFNIISFNDPGYLTLNCSSASTNPFYVYDATQIYPNGCNQPPLLLPTGQNSSRTVCAPGIRQTSCGSVATTCAALNEVPSFDGSFCLACQNTILTTTLSGVSINVCNCPSGQIYYDRNITGGALTTSVCTSCLNGYYPSPDLSTCLPCSDPINMIATATASGSTFTYTCSCKLSEFSSITNYGGTCITGSAYTNAQTLITLPVNSHYPQSTYLYWAAANCNTYGDLQACQSLGNLCTLSMFARTDAACGAYLSMATKDVTRATDYPTFPWNDQPHGLPWLYWGAVSYVSSTTISTYVVPSFSVTISPTAAPLTFVLGVYTINGTFLGYRDMTTELELCSGDESVLSTWNKAGNYFQSSCSMTVQSNSAFETDTLFYEIFLQISAGNYFPVAVRILNTNNPMPDDSPTAATFAASTFSRRFMLVDRLSGLSNGVLSFIRLPTTIRMWIQAAGTSQGYIYTPILDITYTDAPTDTMPMAYSFTFTSGYITDFSSAYRSMEIFIAVFMSFVAIYAFFLTRNWSSRNREGPEAFDLTFLFRLFINLSATTPIFLFWFVVGLSIFLLLFYKTQGVLFVVLPTYSSDLANFSAVLGIIVAMEAINVTKKIFDQCRVELFFLDWEQSRAQPSENLYDQPALLPVSIWRSIFMANEWAKLQAYRICNIELCLVGILIFLEGLSWKNVGTAKPNIQDITSGVVNPILLFAIDSVCWLMFIVGIKLFRYLAYDRFYRNPVNQFMDILSLANISLLVLDEPCHGYYVHGKSVHSSADTNLEELNNRLMKEAHDMVPRRGLLDTNQQSFEVFVTHEFRTVFDKIYKPSDADSVRTMTMMNKLTLNDGTAPKFEEYKAPVGPANLYAKTYKTMNKYLQAFFDQNLKQYPFTTRNKTFAEQIFGASADTSKGSTLMNDSKSIAGSLMLSIENDLLVFYMALFGYVHVSSYNTLFAALTVWLIDIFLRFIRMHFGEKNISQKALLDEKFLI